MNDQQQIKAFFTDTRLRCISISAIEAEAGIPQKTLSHFLKGRRNLNADHVEKLIPVLMGFGLSQDFANRGTNNLKK